MYRHVTIYDDRFTGIALAPHRLFSRFHFRRLLADRRLKKKKHFKKKNFGSSEEAIAEIYAYFETEDKSDGMEKLEKRWNERIALVWDYADE